MLVLLSRWSKLWAYQAVQTALWLQIIATLTARSLVSARKFEMRSACVGHLGCVLFSNEAVACTLLRASFHLTGSVSQWLGGCFAVRKCFFFFFKGKQHPKTILYSVSHWDEMGGGAILRAFTSSLLLGDCFPWARCSRGSQQLPHLYSSVEGNLQSSFVQEKEKQTWMGAYCHFLGFLRWMQECIGDNCWCQGEQHAWNSRDLGRILARYPSVRTARGCSLQRAVSGLGFRGGGCFAHGFAAVKAIKPAPIKKGGYWGQTLDFIPNAESYLQVLGLTSREVRLPVHQFALKSWDWWTFYVTNYSVTLTSGIWDCIYDTLNPTLCSS